MQLPDSRGFTPGYKEYAPMGLSLNCIFEELLWYKFECITVQIYFVFQQIQSLHYFTLPTYIEQIVLDFQIKSPRLSNEKS